MSKAALFVHLVFVLHALSAHASPQNEMPPGAPAPLSADDQSRLNENMQIAKPHAPSVPDPKPEARYYTYQQALTVRGGVATTSGTHDSLIGFQYLFPKFLSPKLEAGADLHPHGDGHINVGARWYWHERSFFRPSVKVGGDLMANSGEGIATFTHIDNYYLRASAALEYVVWDPISLRLEPEILRGTKNTITEISLGLSWGW